MQIYNDDRHNNSSNEHMHNNKAIENMKLGNTMACPNCHAMMKMAEMKIEYKKCPNCNNGYMIPLIHMINLPMCHMAMNMMNNQILWPAYPNSGIQPIMQPNNQPNMNQIWGANNNSLYGNNSVTNQNTMPLSNQINSLSNSVVNSNSLVKTPITAKKASELFD